MLRRPRTDINLCFHTETVSNACTRSRTAQRAVPPIDLDVASRRPPIVNLD